MRGEWLGGMNPRQLLAAIAIPFDIVLAVIVYYITYSLMRSNLLSPVALDS